MVKLPAAGETGPVHIVDCFQLKIKIYICSFLNYEEVRMNFFAINLFLHLILLRAVHSNSTPSCFDLFEFKWSRRKHSSLLCDALWQSGCR